MKSGPKTDKAITGTVSMADYPKWIE